MNLNYATLAGAVAATVIGYDVHSYAKMEAEKGKGENAELLADAFIATTKSEGANPLNDESNKGIFGIILDQNLSEYAHTIGGYVKGAFRTVVANTVPIILTAGALTTKNHKKLWTGALGLWGLKRFVLDYFLSK